MQGRFLLALIAAYGLATSSLAAQTTIRIIDRDSVPIPYALVSVGKGEPRATDAAGRILLKERFGETVSLKVQRIGYQPFQGSVPRVAADGEFLVGLTALPRGLDTVRTVAARETPLSRTGFYDRMDRVRNGAITGEFITPEELELRNPSQFAQILRGRRSVTVMSPPGDRRRRSVALGRGGGCTMTVLLDGVRMNTMLEPKQGDAPTSLTARHSSGRNPRNDPYQDTNLGIDEVTAIGDVMAIEIYPSTANAPAELIPLTGNGSCGIIAIWTGQRR